LHRQAGFTTPLRNLKLLNKAIAVCLSIWILCPGGAHHVVELLFDHGHHGHEGSHQGNESYALTSDEHSENENFVNKEDGGHEFFDHSRDTGTLSIPTMSVIIPACPIAFSTNIRLVAWLDPPGFKAFGDRMPQQNFFLGRTPIREVSGVFLL
jgi:hypothetical protein